MKLENIDQLLSEVFSNLSQCRNCGKWNYTADSKDEKPGWTVCKCGHVWEVKNQQVWH